MVVIIRRARVDLIRHLINQISIYYLILYIRYSYISIILLCRTRISTNELNKRTYIKRENNVLKFEFWYIL